jgi:hypothetical protein
MPGLGFRRSALAKAAPDAELRGPVSVSFEF